MKLKKGIAVLCAFALLITAAGAAAFTDTQGHWAAAYIDDIASSGLVAGYDDGSFKPDKAVTNAEALAFVSRLWKGDAATVAAVQKKWQSVLTASLPSAYSWLQDEAAVCLEAGVLTQSEFAALCTSGALGSAAKKVNLAVWLVKAMQLSPLAATYDTDSLTFTDTASITAAARPYVALLAAAGITVGDDLGNFAPASEVTRGVVATMLSRSLDYMEDNGVVIELAEFTDYGWAAGVVTSVSGSKVTLKSGSSSVSYTLPEGAAVRSEGIKTDLSGDLVGKFALIALDGDKNPVSLSAYTTKIVTGEVAGVTASSVTLSDKTVYPVGRTARVIAGGSVGDRELIDTSEEYEKAECLTDLAGRLLQLTLTGGADSAQGVLYTAYGDLFVTGLDGVTRRIAASKSTDYEVDGEEAELLDVGGHYGTIQYDDDGKAAAVTVDTANEYAVAAYNSTVTQNSRLAMSVKDRVTGKETTYEQTKAGTSVYIGSKKSDLGSLASGYLVQIKLVNGLASELTASSGTFDFEGTVTGIKLGNPIIIDVEVEGGERSLIMIPGNLPAVTTEAGTYSSVDKLAAGDSIKVSYKSATLAAIVVVGVNIGDSDGTVARIELGSDGYLLYLTGSDGTETVYSLSDDCEAEYDGDEIKLSAVIGGKVTLTVDGDGIVTLITLDRYAGSQSAGDADATEVSGPVLYVNTRDDYYLVEGEDGDVTIRVKDSTKYISAAGTGLTFYDIKALDEIIVFGAYEDGEFVATMIIRK